MHTLYDLQKHNNGSVYVFPVILEVNTNYVILNPVYIYIFRFLSKFQYEFDNHLGQGFPNYFGREIPFSKTN